MKNNDKKNTPKSASKPAKSETSKNTRFEKVKTKSNNHFEKNTQGEKIKRENKITSSKSNPSIRSEKNIHTESPKKIGGKSISSNSNEEIKKERRLEDKFEKKGNKTIFKKADKKFDASARISTKNITAQKTNTSVSSSTNETWRLNRYISNSGVCSRREADTLIAKGEISVNGKVIKELGFKVRSNDEVKFKGKILRKEKPVYVLLNKPKDFITTTNDPQGRKTVMDLVAKATTERIYPVGRLDRHTTGLLLFTNDGEMAKKLSHPSYEVQKIYRVQLDKPFAEEDLEKLKAGLTLEDGFAKVDNAAILSPDGFSIGVELHIGKNRIVRRMFAHLGYEVVRLDRTVYAGLTKETLGRGQWRLLNEREIIRLRFFNKRGQ